MQVRPLRPHWNTFVEYLTDATIEPTFTVKLKGLYQAYIEGKVKEDHAHEIYTNLILRGSYNFGDAVLEKDMKSLLDEIKRVVDGQRLESDQELMFLLAMPELCRFICTIITRAVSEVLEKNGNIKPDLIKIFKISADDSIFANIFKINPVPYESIFADNNFKWALIKAYLNHICRSEYFYTTLHSFNIKFELENKKEKNIYEAVNTLFNKYIKPIDIEIIAGVLPIDKNFLDEVHLKFAEPATGLEQIGKPIPQSASSSPREEPAVVDMTPPAVDPKKKVIYDFLLHPYKSNAAMMHLGHIKSDQLTFPFQFLISNFHDVFENESYQENEAGVIECKKDNIVVSIKKPQNNYFSPEVYYYLGSEKVRKWDKFYFMSVTEALVSRGDAEEGSGPAIRLALYELSVTEIKAILQQLENSVVSLRPFMRDFTKFEFMDVGLLPANIALKADMIRTLQDKMKHIDFDTDQEKLSQLTSQCLHYKHILESKDLGLQYRTAREKLASYVATDAIEIRFRDAALRQTELLEGSVSSAHPEAHFEKLETICLEAMERLDELRTRREQHEHERAVNLADRQRLAAELQKNEQILSEERQKLADANAELATKNTHTQILDREFDKVNKERNEFAQQLSEAKVEKESLQPRPLAQRPLPPSIKPPEPGDDMDQRSSSLFATRIRINPNGWRLWLPRVLIATALIVGAAALVTAVLYTGGIIIAPMAVAALASNLSIAGFAVGGALLGAALVGLVMQCWNGLKGKKRPRNDAESILDNRGTYSVKFADKGLLNKGSAIIPAPDSDVTPPLENQQVQQDQQALIFVAGDQRQSKKV